jgi:signal transduction histidine kinase
MEINPHTIFNILSSFPGNLVYYLILVYSITTCLLSIWTNFRVNELPLPALSLAGLSILLIACLLPLVYLVIAEFISPLPVTVYPLLERTSLTLLMIWSAWLWLGPHPSRIINIATVIFSLVIPAIVYLTAYFFPENPVAFNATLADICWHFLVIVTVLFYTFLLIHNKPAIWPFGIAMMALMLAGFTISLAIAAPQGSISGAARLGILCAFPFLPLLARRYDMEEMPVQESGSFEHVMTQASSHPVPDEINAWLSAVSNLDLVRQQESVARMLCQTLDAQGCALLQLSEKLGIIRVTAGYDLLHQSWLEPREILAEEFPKTLNGLINTDLVIIRNSNENSLELSRFSEQFKLAGINSAAILPLKNTNVQWGSAILFRTAPAPSFLMETLQQFTQTASALSHIFRNNETAIRERQDLIKLSAELDSLQTANQTLQANLESLRLSAVQIHPQQNTLQMLTLQQASESEIDRLRSENHLLLQTLADEKPTEIPEEIIDQAINAEELALTRAEVYRLQNLLQDSRLRLKEIQKRSTISATSMEGLRKFNNLITEIRHPLATITGYVDLIVSGESSSEALESGLTSMENLKASLVKLRLIMNDLADSNVLSSGVIDMEPELMDLGNAIDQAVVTISAGYMDKEISLRLDLPPVLPYILTYHEALKKVILYLLQNAGKVTPRGGSVVLRVEVHQENSEPYLLIEVTDHGGGIAPEDISKVFLPVEELHGKYISGLGEINGGLASSKTLVEAHGGRIWVDSDPGVSTTFSVLLPIQSDRKK